MPNKFETVAIYGRVKNPGVLETLKALITYLSDLSVKILIEEITAEPLDQSNLSLINRDQIGKMCDLLIVVGGDGSLLHATHAIMHDEIPVIGINRGSLGFLTDIHPGQLEKIKHILQGEYIIEERALLSAYICKDDTILNEDSALNEVAIIPDAIPHMIEFEIYVDNTFVCSQISDGLIIATPTGSTAYALSGGGPILHPHLNAMVLVPMFPHSLSSRPIVVEGDKEILITIPAIHKHSPRVSCDGKAYLPLPLTSHLKIKKKKQKLQLVHPVDYNYYEALRSKLHWGQKLQYKE